MRKAIDDLANALPAISHSVERTTDLYYQIDSADEDYDEEAQPKADRFRAYLARLVEGIAQLKAIRR